MFPRCMAPNSQQPIAGRLNADRMHRSDMVHVNEIAVSREASQPVPRRLA